MADVTVTESNVTVTVAAPGPQGLSGTSGGSLGDLSDTLLESLANKDLLFYESSSSKWKNAAIDTTYVSGLGTAAVKNTGTSQSSVIIGNDARLSNPRTPTDHSADKVTTGIFGVDRIPALAASKITSGTLGVDRIPAISTDKLTSGTLPVGRGGTGLTSVSTLLNSNTTKSDVGLSAVENTALSTWAGSGDITTVGTISNGTWAGTAIEYSALGSKPVLGTAAALNVGTGNLNVVQLSGVGAMPAVSGSALTGLNAGNFTSGTLAVARGGTGLTSISTLLNSNTTKSDVGLANVTNIVAQPVNADLTAIAGLTSAADKGIQFTGSGTAAVYDLTAAGKALLDDADATAQRNTLGLGTAATSATGDFVASSAVSTFGATLVDDADAAAARTTLGAAATNHTHAASQLTGDMPDARIVASNVTQHAAQIDVGDLGNVTQAAGLLGAGSGLYWNGSAWAAGALQATSVPSLSAYATAAHTHTDSYAMFIVTGVDKAAPGFVLDGKVATARTITEFYTKTSGGSCTATLKNGSNEIGQIATDGTGKVDSSLTNTSVSAGDRLGVVITLNSSALDLEIVVKYTA